MLTTIGTGAKGRRSVEGGGSSKGGRGPESRGGALGRDGTTSGRSVLTGGSQEAEGDQRGTGADGAGATGRDAGMGAGHYSHTRWRNTRAFNSSGRSDTEGVQEVHGLFGGT